MKESRSRCRWMLSSSICRIFLTILLEGSRVQVAYIENAKTCTIEGIWQGRLIEHEAIRRDDDTRVLIHPLSFISIKSLEPDYVIAGILKMIKEGRAVHGSWPELSELCSILGIDGPDAMTILTYLRRLQQPYKTGRGILY